MLLLGILDEFCEGLEEWPQDYNISFRPMKSRKKERNVLYFLALLDQKLISYWGTELHQQHNGQKF